MRHRFTSFLIALLLAIVSMPVEGQSNPTGFERCGDENLVLVFLNPDLTVQDDGYVHASGAFFIQFQARGERAMEIEKFTFSFGKPVPPSMRTCDAPEWVTGGYLKNYRSDTDWRDGFFVPINTYNVPDGEYGAAVSAYDAQGNELVRYYTQAIVDNGGRTTPQDPWPVEDDTMPWPMILPGDGERTDGGGSLYIEVAEELSEIQGWINGKRLELTEVPAPMRDDDAIPDLGYGPLEGTELAEGQIKNRQWGPAYEWNGVVNDADVVKVRAVDMWGNVAEKVVHIGDPTIGGRVVAGSPEFEIEVEEEAVETDGNGTALWNVTYRTLGEEGIHGDVYLRAADGGELPDGYNARLSPNHVVLGGQEELRGQVRLIAGDNATMGKHTFRLQVEYLNYDTRVTEEVELTATITSRSSDPIQEDEVADKGGTEQENYRGTSLDAANNTDEVEQESSGGADTPAPAALLTVLVAVALARVQGRRAQ